MIGTDFFGPSKYLRIRPAYVRIRREQIVAESCLADEFAKTIREEMDYEREARMLTEIRSNFADDDGLVRLLLLDNDGGTLGRSPSGNNPIDFVRRQAALDDAMTLAVETGNLDFDRAHELAVIVNEYQSPFGSNSNDSASRYAVFDDANTDFAELASGDANILGVAKGADIALGDVDGDNVAEVIWGGLSHIGSECSELAAKNADYIVVVLDDAPREFAVMRSHTEPYDVVPQACSSGASRQLTFVHVNAADVDDDGATEIQANGLIFEDLRQDAGSGGLTVAYTIPSEQFLWEAQSGSDGTFTWKSSSMAVGDATSDKSDDIIFVTDAFNVGDVIRVYGINPLNDEWENLHNVPFESFSIDQRPLVVPANVNDDSLAIAYSDGSYRLVFTEPLIIAALAAAPCNPGAGQDVGDCRTAFGKGTSTSTSVETGWSVSAGTSVGFEQEFSALGVKFGGVEAVASVQSETRKFTENTYTLTKRVIHTTGPIEDSVIFTTTPLDVYTYEILSHPNPELIGGEVQVRLPREPISIMTDREFYNDTVDEGSLKIDERIFEHAEGDPFSYPTTSERNTLLSRFDGVQSDEIDVGQGTGFVTADVNIFEEVTSGESYSLDVSLDVRATGGGLVTGYSIGSGVDSAVAYGRGQESIYQGSVAQLPAENFPDDAYRFGLFSYVYEDGGSGQEFEVVNYWVHTRFLQVEGEKMSKSKGNFYTVRDLINPDPDDEHVPDSVQEQGGIDPLALRYALMQGQYRKPFNFTIDTLQTASRHVRRFQEAKERVDQFLAEHDATDGDNDPAGFGDQLESYYDDTLAAMCKDLNTPAATSAALAGLKVLEDKLDTLNWAMAKSARDWLDRTNALLGVVESEFETDERTGDAQKDVPKDDHFAETVDELLEDREAARADGEYARADAIRDTLDALGIEVMDTPNGSEWRRKVEI